jgi:hypothetical protein
MAGNELRLLSPVGARGRNVGGGLYHRTMTARQVACQVCRGPAAAGFARCYRCDLHWRAAGGLLADAVVPIGYAVKGTRFARDLWRYKWDDDDAAADRLRRMLRDFLRDHGGCVQRAAGMTGPPGRLAVVPSGQGRPGAHPLAALVAPSLAPPPVRLSPGPQPLARGREIDPGWVRVDDRVAGQSVIVVDDTWVSGSSAQSVAAALKRAGAVRVAVVVLGRHVSPDDPRATATGWPARVPHPCYAARPATP